ncbi:MAG: tetratricopeptide repeat protein, partial [Spirochaetaceae bacterium]|nr:tetratricopeptide repeat protein [Spirochaetaceae bacterium]
MKKILSVVFILLCAAGTAAFAQGGNARGDLFPLPEEAIRMEYDLLYEMARNLDPESAGKDAVPLLELIHALKPEKLWPVESLGMVYCYISEERPSFPNGLPWLLEAERMNSRDAALYYNLACVYSLRSEPDKAASAMDKALVYGYWNIDWMKEDEDLINLRSTPWWEENIEQDGESRVFNAAARLLETDPGFAGAYFARGREYAKREDFPKALEQYNRAIECDPGYRDAYSDRAWLYLHLGDIDKWIADYTQVWRHDPDALNTYTRDALNIADGGQYRFIDDFIRTMQNNPEYAALFLTGVWERINQEERTEEEAVEAAASALTRAIALEPRVAFTYVCRGSLYEFTGDFNRLVDDMAVAVMISPDIAAPLIRYFERNNDDLYEGFSRALRTNREYAALCFRSFLFYAKGDYP